MNNPLFHGQVSRQRSMHDGTFPSPPAGLANFSLDTRLLYHESYTSYDSYDTLHVPLDHALITLP